ncbi:MAG: hypothetical protein RLZZ574_1957 [Cyanobacteriota bacterium]|jgi:hypothetical protein
MAKRRNAKKEKAARNKINARKFRKQTSRYGNNRGKRNYNGNSDNKETADANNGESDSGDN